ncbi:hypothetical protein GCM10009839_54880 [Catenulispora yoronensis]|uniref:Lipoprotein n=1 Tax=Catenulispora yoronensis TaxID=450799 RepID=A0ABN2UWN8_9ACTN
MRSRISLVTLAGSVALTAVSALAAGCAAHPAVEHTAASVPAQCAPTPDVDREQSSGSRGTIEPLTATSLTLCGYGPAPDRKLEAHLVVTDAATIDTLRTALNKAKGTGGRTFKCANDSGVVVIEKFQGDGREVDLSQDAAGCGLVSDGDRSVFDADTAAPGLVLDLLPADYCRRAFPGQDCPR